MKVRLLAEQKSFLLLTFLLLLIALPFVQRAYFVDDYYFVTMARGILQHPARPYDFVSDDAGIANVAWERGHQPRMVNPPLFHYFLAAVIKVWGDDVWKLRTASLLFSLISLWMMYLLGRRFVQNSFAAASLMAVTPAFWLTSYSLLIDSALLAFFLLALACFVYGQEKKSVPLFVVCGVFMGLTLLTKYTGALILPLLLLLHWMNRETYAPSGTIVAFAVCGGLFLFWGWWGIQTYGQMHFAATLSRGFHPTAWLGLCGLLTFTAGLLFWWKEPGKRVEALPAWACWLFCLVLWSLALWKGPGVGHWLQLFYFDKIISVASFLGGCTVFLLLAPVFLYRTSPRMAVAWGGGVLLLFAVFASRFGGFERVQSVMLALFIGSAGAFILCLLLRTSPRSNRFAVFLFSWLVLGLLELILVMPWTAARYLLILLPPVCWFFRRWVEETGSYRLWRMAWAATALMGATLASADFSQAGVIQSFSQILEAQREQFQRLAPQPPRQWFYLGDTFSGAPPYVTPLGWKTVFPFQDIPRGSLLIRARFRTSSWWNLPEPQRFEAVTAWEFESRNPFRVLDIPASAGFYASVWGSLPYVWTDHPLERFELSRVR